MVSGLDEAKVIDRPADVSPATVKKQVSEFLVMRSNVVRHDMCVMQWMVAKINKQNKRMLKAEAVLRVMRSKTKILRKSKSLHTQSSVCYLHDKVASTWTLYYCGQIRLAYTIESIAQITYTSYVLCWQA